MTSTHPHDSAAKPVTDKMVDLARSIYKAKVAEYDRDFRTGNKPEGFWERKYGTNLHATHLGEEWAMRTAIEAALLASPDGIGAGTVKPLRERCESAIGHAFKAGFVRGQDAREKDPNLNEWFDRWFTVFGAGILAKFDAISTPNPGDADGWRAMDSAPLDGTHCILAVQSGAFIYSVQGNYDPYYKTWDCLIRSNVKPLAWMPNVLLPDWAKPWVDPTSPASSLREGSDT